MSTHTLAHRYTLPSKRITISALLLGAGLLLLQVAFWHSRIQGFYHPVGDDFALLVHSTRVFGAHPAEWFTRGFADYFEPYPDISASTTQFLRPADNAVFYLNSLLFGRHWAAYLFANYFLAAALCAVVFGLARGVLRLSFGGTALVTLATAVSPAYTINMLYDPAFAFDYLGAVCAVLCAFYLVRQRFVAAWLFVCLAVLSKETAFYAAIAAFVVVLLAPKRPAWRRLRASAFLLPLFSVLALRRFDFRHTTGAYVLVGLTPKDILRNITLAFTHWIYLLPGQSGTQALLESHHDAGSLLLNALGWGSAGYFVFRCGREYQNRSEEPDPQLVLLIFFVGSCCLPTALGLGLRFTASMLPLLCLTLAALRGRVVHRIGVTLLCFLILEGSVGIAKTCSSTQWGRQTVSWKMAESLVQQVAEEKSNEPRFLIADLSEGYSSGRDISTFSGAYGPLIPISSIALREGCAAPVSVRIAHSNTGYRIHSLVPTGCGSYNLFGAVRPNGADSDRLERHLPQATVGYLSPTPSQSSTSYVWRTLDVDLTPKTNDYIILAPDVMAQRYRVIARN